LTTRWSGGRGGLPPPEEELETGGDQYDRVEVLLHVEEVDEGDEATAYVATDACRCIASRSLEFFFLQCTSVGSSLGIVGTPWCTVVSRQYWGIVGAPL